MIRHADVRSHAVSVYRGVNVKTLHLVIIIFLVIISLNDVFAAEIILTHSSGRITKVVIDDVHDPVLTANITKVEYSQKIEGVKTQKDKDDVSNNAKSILKSIKMKWAKPVE